MSDVKRRVYQDNDRYTARLEETDGLLFVHVVIKQMNKQTISTIRDEFEKLKKKLKQAGYEVVNTYSATPKFYKMFPGYNTLGHMEVEGEKYEVLQWVLK